MNILAVTEINIRGSPPGGEEVAPLRPSTGAREPEPARPKAEDEPPPPRDVEKAAEGVNAFLKSSGSHVQFAYSQEAKRMTVEVIDDRTQTVIRTIPSKELLDLAAKIGEMVGILLDKKG